MTPRVFILLIHAFFLFSLSFLTLFLWYLHPEYFLPIHLSACGCFSFLPGHFAQSYQYFTIFEASPSVVAGTSDIDVSSSETQNDSWPWEARWWDGDCKLKTCWGLGLVGLGAPALLGHMASALGRDLGSRSNLRRGNEMALSTGISTIGGMNSLQGARSGRKGRGVKGRKAKEKINTVRCT